MASLTRAERLKKYGLNRDGSVNEELQRQNADVFTRVGETLLDVGGTFAKSVVRGAEGLVEGVVGVAGEVGSIFGADTQWAEDIITQTWTEDVFSGLPEATKNSFINELSEGGQETVRGIIDGVGQVATATGLSFIHPAVAMTYMGASAAGRSMEEALHDGASFTDAVKYGVTQGGLEAALEYVTGGASKLAKIGGKQAIKSTGKLIAGEALQEAAQEGIQGAINPITKQIYKGSEALEEYKQEGFWQDVGKQALIGGVSGSMGAGMGVGIQTAAAGGRKQFKVANASAQVQEALNETAEKYAKGKMSDTQLASAVDDISAMNDRLEGFVSKLSFEQQQKMFQPNGEKPAKYRIPQGFEWTDNGLVRTSKATEENFNELVKQGRASVSLLGREKEVSRLLEQTGATIYRGELASDEKANYNKVRKFHQALASKGLVRSNLILVDEMAKAEAFNSGDIIVLGKDQLSSEAGVKKILHEVTHFAEGTKEYKKFANFVLSLDGIKDINKRILNTSGYGVTQDVIDSAIKKFKAGKELTKAEKTYISEAVAFSAEALLSDEATIERLCQTDRNLAQKILRKIKEFIKVISGRFDGDEQLLKDLRKAEKLYIKALAKSGTEYLVKQQKAAENKINEEDAVKHSFSSISYTFFGEDGISIDQLEKEYRNTEGYKKYVEQCLNNMRQSIESFNEKDAREEIEKSIEGIVKVAVAMKKAGYDIFDDKAQRNTKDSKKRLLFSSLEPNSDYITSSDISTICDKRQNFAEIYDDIIRKEEELGVPADKRFFSNVDNYFVIHKIMAEKGLTQPCQQCYVESMRKNLHPMAEKFIQLIKEENENNTHNDQLYHQEGKDKGKQKANNAKLRKRVIKEINSRESLISMDDITIETLATESGLARLKVQAPLVYEAFNSFYGQSKPKMPKKATPFRFGELTALLTDSRGKIKKSLVNKIVSTGGFRFQSYSDFQLHNFVDVLQVLFEAGTLGLNGHAYTKVPAFISATKNTNLKRNISIFMYNDGGKWKLDRNDSFPYKLESIYDIVKEDKSGNTGIIAVVQNKDMAAWVMANDQVGFFIPFHKSGLKMDTVRDTVVVDEEGRKVKGYAETKDHTRQQTEVYKETETKVDKGINIYKFWDFDNKDNLSKNELIKKNVMAYVDACEEVGYIPKFREYIMNNDDVLEGVLSYSKELGFVAEDATVEDICFEYKGYKIPYGYYKCLGDFGMFTPDGQASPIERLSLKNYDFDEAVDFFKNVESIKREEILQQFSNGKVREKYRNSDMTTAELVEEYQALRQEVVNEVVYRENDEIRFALKEDPKYELSKGQVTKLKANYTREKAYARKEAEAIINTVLADHLDFGEEFGTIANKNKEEVVDILWQGLNGAGGSQGKVADKVAEYILDHAVLQNIYDDADNDIYVETIEVLKPYLHSINLDSLKGEIAYRNNNSIYAMWGKRKGEAGFGVDEIAQVLEEQGFVINATADADILFEIDGAYRKAVSELKKKTKDLLKDSFSEEDIYQLKNAIKRDVMIGFDEKGSKSKLSKIIEEYRQKAYNWKRKFYDEKDKNKWERNVLYQVDKIKDIKWKTFLNATQYKNDVFRGSIESLARIENRGSLNRKGTRTIIAGFREWYKQDNPILEYQDKENTGLFVQEIADILDGIADNVKPLTKEQETTIQKLRAKSGLTDYKDLYEWYTYKNLNEYDGETKALLRELGNPYIFSKQELVGLNKVLGYFTHFIDTYNKILRNGEYVEAQPLAQGFIDVIDKNQQIRVGWQEKGQIITKYMELMGDPMTVARQMDKYEYGFNTDTMENLRQDAMKAQVAEMEARAKIDAFLKRNKNYIEKVSKRKVKYLDHEIPLAEAMSLYLSLGRKQLISGVVETGIQIGVGKDRINIDGVLQDGDEYLYQSYANEIRGELERQFTDADRECVAIIKETLNNECRKMKVDTDMAMHGYTNVEEGDDYFPARRADIAKSVDSETFFDEMDRVSNASFNKNIVKGAKQRLYIEPIFTVVDRHVRSVSLYAHVAPTIHAYNVLYNLDVGGNKNKPVSIKTKMEKTWATHRKYIEKLVADIQMIPSAKGDGTALDVNKILGAARGAYARYQIGGNPKVILTQTSSLIAAVNILDVKSVIKGLGTKVSDEEVDKFCPLAKLRNYDNTAAMAQAVFDRKSMTVSRYKAVNALRKFSDWLMKFVGKMDRFVIKKLYGACQIEVEKKYNIARGTEVNKQKAGELLAKVIFETQQNSLATERSAAMRSGSEFLKATTMFSADAMKGFGRFFDAIGEYSTLKARRKVATDQAEIKKIDARLNKAGKQVVKSTSVLISSAVFMALVAQFFRWLYNKDDEDEDVVANMTVDAVGNLLGGLPLVRDLYNRAFQGYEIQGYSYSAINAIFDATVAVPDAVITLVSDGDSRETAKALKDLINAAGMVTGVPTRNIYNVGYGLTKRISPATVYKIDDAFYSQGYRADLAKALENEDEAMVATIAGLMLNENIGGITDSSARKNIDDLVKKGFDVLPKSVSTQITYNDETVELSASQQKRFKEVYNEANKALASLVKLPQYSRAADEVRAKAIRFIFDTYHNLAKQDVLGVELETKNVLFAEAIDLAKLAIIVATVNQMTADTKNGKVVSGSKKLKVEQYVNSLSLTAAQKYMVMGYLGYKNTNGEAQVKSYINRLNLTSSEKEKLLSYSGY